MNHYQTYINGKWVDGTSGQTLYAVNPATGQAIGAVEENSLADTEEAIRAAKTSFYVTRQWRDMDVQKRSDILLKIAYMIEEELEEYQEIKQVNLNLTPGPAGWYQNGRK